MATKHVEYVQCRLLGHAWENFIPFGNARKLTGYGLTLRCTRCGTERFDEVNNLGGLDRRRYDYPEDYRIAKDDRPSHDSMRVLFAQVNHIKYRKKSRGAA